MIKRTDKLNQIKSGFDRYRLYPSQDLGNPVKQLWLKNLRLSTKVPALILT